MTQHSPGRSYELSAAHRKVLTSNRTFLVHKLDPFVVMSPLIRRRIIAAQDKDLVTRHSREDAVRNLLNMLARSGPNALIAFVESLLETGQHEVATKLRNDAPDVAAIAHDGLRFQETNFSPLRGDLTYKDAMRILRFHSNYEESSPQVSNCFSTLIISFASYHESTGRRPLPQNRVFAESLSAALEWDPSFEVLPRLDDWSAAELTDEVQFFAQNSYETDGVMVCVFGHATEDLQSLYTCDDELISIKDVLLDPIVAASHIVDKPKLFLFNFTVPESSEPRSLSKFTYGFATEEVMVFRMAAEDDIFIDELCQMLRSNPKPGMSSLERFETVCRKRCDQL